LINRVRNPIWSRRSAPRATSYVRIGKENYMISADGTDAPKKGQAPPELRYFKVQK